MKHYKIYLNISAIFRSKSSASFRAIFVISSFFAITTIPIISCQSKVSNFSKSTLWIEIQKQHNNKKNNLNNTKQIKYNNNSIMILGKNAKSISLFNTNSKKTLLLGKQNSQPNAILYKDSYQNNKINNNKTKISQQQIKNYPFRLIRDFTADNKNGIYIIELIKENKKLFLYILRFSKQGKLLYKIGKNGKITNSNNNPQNNNNQNNGFLANKAIQHFYCDKNGYLYLIMKKPTTTPFPSTKLNLHVFDNNGKLIIYKENIETLLPKINQHATFIEDIKISPLSKELITLTAYYNKKNKSNQIAPVFKTIYNTTINNKINYKNTHTLYKLKKENELNLSIFGITKLNNLFLFANIPYYNPKTFIYTYYFKVISKTGKEKELKTLKTPKEPNEQTRYLILGDKEEIACIIIYTNKIICHFYV